VYRNKRNRKGDFLRDELKNAQKETFMEELRTMLGEYICKVKKKKNHGKGSNRKKEHHRDSHAQRE